MNIWWVYGVRVEASFRESLKVKLGEVKLKELEEKIENTLHVINKIPSKERLQELKDYAIQEIKAHAQHKNLLPKPWSLLDKVLSDKI